MDRENALLDYFVPPDGGYRLESFVATTYQIDFDFLESELLPIMLGVKSRGAALQAFRADLEAQLERCNVTILYDVRGADGCRTSPRIDTLGIWKKKLHAKIYLMLWSRRGKRVDRVERLCRMVIGSANLTKSAFRANYEVASVMEFGKDDGAPKHLLSQALKAVSEIAVERTSPQLKRQLHAMGQFCDGLPAGRRGRDAPWRFVGARGVKPGLKEALKSCRIGEITRFIAVSPFWAEGEKPWEPVVDLIKGIGISPPVVELICEGHILPSGSILPVIPQSIGPETAKALDHKVKVRIRAVLPSVGVRESNKEGKDSGELTETDDLGGASTLVQSRALHAKMFAVEGKNGAVLYIGSSNFTRRGLGVNSEAGLIYLLPGWARKVIESLTAIAGEGIYVQAGQSPKVKEPQRGPEEPVPSFMKDVVALGAQIRITFDAATPVPRDLCVLAPEESPGQYRVLLRGRSKSRQVTVDPNKCPRCDSSLRARATNGDALASSIPYVELRWGKNTGRWPVRYDDKASLRRVNQTAGYSESELIEYFRTGREPGGGVEPGGGPGAPPPTPHPRKDDPAIDTSRILSYQIRRFIEALPGIARSLEDAAYSEPALRSALLGPASPIELATRAVEALRRPRHGEPFKTPVAAAFQIVELISLLDQVGRRVDRRMKPLIRRGIVQLTKALNQLEGDHPGIQGLGAYRDNFVRGLK